MSSPTTRQAYTDIYEIWDRALSDPRGIRIQVADWNKANFIRMRLHQARVITREDNLRMYEPDHPMYGASPYDKLQCRIWTDRTTTPIETWLYIELRTTDIIGEPQPLSEIEEVRWLEQNSPLQLGSPTGIKLLTKRSESESKSSIDGYSSTDSTRPEKEPTIPGLRRL